MSVNWDVDIVYYQNLIDKKSNNDRMKKAGEVGISSEDAKSPGQTRVQLTKIF